MPNQLDEIKKILVNSGLEVEENFRRINSHANFSYLNRAINNLHEGELLDKKNLSLLIESKNPVLAADVIISFSKENIADQKEIEIVLKHRYPQPAMSALINLKKAGLLNEKFRQEVINDNFTAVPAINRLAEGKILDETRLESVLQCSYPASVASTVADANEVGLSKEIETAILNHRGLDALSLEGIIHTLKQQQLLTPEVTEKLLECRYLPLAEQQASEITSNRQQHALFFLGSNITLLKEARILHEANIHRLLDTVQQCRNDDQANSIFSCYLPSIPSYRLDQNAFNGFIASCEGGQQATNEYLRVNFGIIFDDVEAFNAQQSTHVDSVEESVSHIALELKQRYGDQLAKEGGADAVLDRIENHLLLESLEGTSGLEPYKIEAALSYIKDVRSQIEDPFKDSRSNISLPEVVALSRLAIEDSEKRIGSDDDAFKAVIQGYYEAEREYNLDIKGQEKLDAHGNREEANIPACRGGQFNKSINAIQGQYEGADIAYATTRTATDKLQALIKQKVFGCLEQNFADVSHQDLQIHGDELLKQLEKNLEETRQDTLHQLWDEFSVFPSVFGDSNVLEEKLNACQAMVDAGYDACDLEAMTQEYIKTKQQEKEFTDLMSDLEKDTEKCLERVHDMEPLSSVAKPKENTIREEDSFDSIIADLERDTQRSQATGLTIAGLFRSSTSNTLLAEEERTAREEMQKEQEQKEREKQFSY